MGFDDRRDRCRTGRETPPPRNSEVDPGRPRRSGATADLRPPRKGAPLWGRLAESSVCSTSTVPPRGSTAGQWRPHGSPRVWTRQYRARSTYSPGEKHRPARAPTCGRHIEIGRRGLVDFSFLVSVRPRGRGGPKRPTTFGGTEIDESGKQMPITRVASIEDRGKFSVGVFYSALTKTTLGPQKYF